MVTSELISRLKVMPQDLEVYFYIKDLSRESDKVAYNWRDITRIEHIDYCEHDDYICIDLDKEPD